MNTGERYHFKVGAFDCVVIRDDTEVYPIGDLTADVPQNQLAQVLFDQGFPPAELSVDFACLLIDTGKHRVLIDTGWGCGTQRREGRLCSNLEAEGIRPQDIDVIFITHSDRDRTGGILDAAGQPTFPNARYVMWRGGWDAWLKASQAGSPEGVAVFDRRVLELLRDQVELVDSGKEFLPGFQVIPAVGHRPEHTALSVSSGSEQLLHVADALVHPVLIEHSEWHWPYHSSREQARRDKQILLARAAAQDALVFGAHLPFPGLGYVTRWGGRWHWQPIAT